MSFPSTFSSQVAAIMDVLSKAAAAEITKLVDDGSLVLRLEICRRDGEIQELKKSLKHMEAELCKAQEAARSQADLCKAQEAARLRPPEDKQESTVSVRSDGEGLEPCGVYLERAAADSLCEPPCERAELAEINVVKSEPIDEFATQEAKDSTAFAPSNVSFDAEGQAEPLWPPPACSMFDKPCVDAAHVAQQQLHRFPSHTAEQYAAHRNTESTSKSSSTAAEEIGHDSFNVPVKVELEVRPMCMRGVTLEPVANKQLHHVSHPAAGDERRLQSTLQQAGPPAAPPQAPMSTDGMLNPNAGPHMFSRNMLRAKRTVNVWKASQKVFTCSVCSKGFPRLTLLEEHKASHGAFKPFRCLECGKSFTQKTRLKTHQSVHTGERPFSCKICGKMFSRQDNCLRHERFHSGLKPFTCGQCGKSFTALSNLKIHQEIHLRRR